jgi:hypothetical protein
VNAPGPALSSNPYRLEDPGPLPRRPAMPGGEAPPRKAVEPGARSDRQGSAGFRPTGVAASTPGRTAATRPSRC